MRLISAVHASSDSFKGMGAFIANNTDTQGLKPSNQSEIQTFYGKLGIMECKEAIEFGLCIAKNRPIRITQLEQHAKSSELLVALSGDFISPVSPSIIKDGRMIPDIDKVIAVRVNQGEGIIFNVGIWHWTPYPVEDTATILVAFKKNTPEEDFILENLSDELIVQ